MSLTPLKGEIAEIAALLEQGAESPTDLAKRVVKRVYELAEERTAHVVVFELSPGVYQAYGPFPTRSRAEAAVSKIPMAQVARRGAHATLHGMRSVDAAMAAADEVPEVTGAFAIVKEDAALFRKGWNGKQATRASFATT